VSAVTIHPSVPQSLLSNPEIRSLARSLGLGVFGGLLCAYVINLRFPQLVADGISLKHILFFGSALGFYLSRLISKLIGQTLRPLYDCTAYYGKIVQLELQQRHNLMSKEDYQTIKRRLDFAYFLGEHPKKDGSAVQVETDNGRVEQRKRQPKTIRRPRVVDSTVSDLQF